jgi:hypothetical protein
VTLSKGTLWSLLGVTCNVGPSTVLCFNTANHGFVIGNGKYSSFLPLTRSEVHFARL